MSDQLIINDTGVENGEDTQENGNNELTTDNFHCTSCKKKTFPTYPGLNQNLRLMRSTTTNAMSSLSQPNPSSRTTPNENIVQNATQVRLKWGEKKILSSRQR